MMVSRRRREREAAERAAALRQAQEAAAQRQRDAAKTDKARRRRLGSRRPWRPEGLRRRWAQHVRAAQEALKTIEDAKDTVSRASEPGRAFAQAQTHLSETLRSAERGMGRCQDIALAAHQLEETIKALGDDQAEDRGRLTARLEEAEERIRQHVAAMQSAAVAARELALQSTLTSQDEEAVLDIDARLRVVSQLLDKDGRHGS